VRRVVVFFGLAIAITWSAWLVWARLAGGVRWLFFYVGVVAPALSALWLTWKEGGGSAVRTLLARLFQWRVGAWWYGFAIAYMAGIKLLAATLYRLTTGVWPPFGAQAWYVMIAATVGSTVVGGQAGEEIGWRGYALPRMAERLGFAGASVLLGLLWATWHLPLFYIAGADIAGQSFPVFALLVTALSVAIAWLYTHTGGSLLPVMLLHAAVNNTTGIVPSATRAPAGPLSFSASPMAWLTLGLMWLAAALFLMRLRRVAPL
jgi:CAAX protease family protein